MILVTGYSGYVGTMVMRQLHRAGVKGFVGLDLRADPLLPDDITTVHDDIRNEDAIYDLLQLYQVDYIIHCAADVVVPDSVFDPLAYYDNNTVGTLNLIQAAVQAAVKGVVFASTAAVYGDPEFVRPLKEDDVKRPCSPYGWSKRMSEIMLEDVYKAYGLRSVSLRYFNVAGADPLRCTGQVVGTHLLKQACQAALGHGNLIMYGDGSDVRDYVHVADVARATIGAVEFMKENTGSHVFNIGTGVGTTVTDMLDMIATAHGKLIPFRTKPRREGDPTSIVADTRLSEEVLKWTPEYGIKSIIEDALEWEKILTR